jgi:hypothetical protein
MINTAHTPLPETVAELTEMINSLVREHERSTHENNLLREEIRLLRAKLFGKKSEKPALYDESPQLSLFSGLSMDAGSVKELRPRTRR